MKEAVSPLVSIVLPAYKGKFFSEAVRSILAQTYKSFELIVVDDASPFNIKKVIDELDDNRIVYHRNHTNIGGKDLSEAYNHACSFARGKYLVLASDDDVYMPTYLERMVALAESNPDVSLFSCMVGHIDETGELSDVGVPVLPHETALFYMMMHEFRRRHLTLFEWFMRRSSLDAVGGIARSPLGWFSDVKTMYLLAAYKKGGVRYAPEMLGAFRDSSIQVSNPSKGVLEKCAATLEFYEWFDRFIRENGAELVISDLDRVVLRRLIETYPAYAKALLLQLLNYAGGFKDSIKIAKKISGCQYVKRRSVFLALVKKCICNMIRVIA